VSLTTPIRMGPPAELVETPRRQFSL
jgi:hypothetical protein